MSDRSTDDPLEVFVDILRRAIAHHEVVLRVVRRTLSLLETSQSREGEHFQTETSRVATLFADVCHGGTTRVRVSSTGVRIRNFFSLEENDLALITSPKTFAVARAGFKHMFHTAVEEEGGSYESANVSWTDFKANERIQTFFEQSTIPRHVFHYFKSVVMRELPQKFYYSAHLVGTALRRTDPRSADVWMNLLFCCTFPSSVHVAVVQSTPALSHLRVWREVPKTCERFSVNLQRLARRHLHFSGQRNAAVECLRRAPSADLNSFFLAIERGTHVPENKALTYAAWTLDANPLGKTRRNIAERNKWRKGTRWVPFVSPDLFAKDERLSPRKRKSSHLSDRLARFVAVWECLSDFNEALDVSPHVWLNLHELSSSSLEKAQERAKAIVTTHPHLCFAANRVTADARRLKRPHLSTDAEVARVEREIRRFVDSQSKTHRVQHVQLREGMSYEASRANVSEEVLSPEACVGGNAETLVQWLEKRSKSLLVFIFEDPTRVSWMDVHITVTVVWKRLSMATEDHVRAIRHRGRVTLFVDAGFAAALAHASSLRTVNAQAIDFLFEDGRFDNILEAFLTGKHSEGALARARKTEDALAYLRRETGENASRFSDLIACENTSSR